MNKTIIILFLFSVLIFPLTADDDSVFYISGSLDFCNDWFQEINTVGISLLAGMEFYPMFAYNGMDLGLRLSLGYDIIFKSLLLQGRLTAKDFIFANPAIWHQLVLSTYFPLPSAEEITLNPFRLETGYGVSWHVDFLVMDGILSHFLSYTPAAGLGSQVVLKLQLGVKSARLGAFFTGLMSGVLPGAGIKKAEPDLRKLPIYDINNIPISVWIIEQKSNNVGFIIAGHAHQEICQLASLEVISRFERIKGNAESYYGFGIGYDFRFNNRSSSYNQEIAQMRDRFEKLAVQFPEEVKVNVIQQDEYLEALGRIEAQVKGAGRIEGYDRIIVEHKLERDFPLIIPYHQADGTPLVIELDAAVLGKIPTEIFFEYYQGIIDSWSATLEEALATNSKAIREIKEGFKGKKGFRYYHYLDGNGYLVDLSLDNDPPPSPVTDFRLITKDQYDRVISEEKITWQKAEELLDSPDHTSDFTKKDMEELRKWIKICEDYPRQLQKLKDETIAEIETSNKALEQELDKLTELLKDLFDGIDAQAFVIDAFLRGWPVATDNFFENAVYREWYRKRQEVWRTILSGTDWVESPRQRDNIAGIFQQDNVFFRIEQSTGGYAVTPCYVSGDELLQVIDKQTGLSRIFTPFNFR